MIYAERRRVGRVGKLTGKAEARRKASEDGRRKREAMARPLSQKCARSSSTEETALLPRDELLAVLRRRETELSK
jgi:hypothetical protein